MMEVITFPYGNKYGWGAAHKKKQKLICNIFAEDNAFAVMVMLSNKQYDSVYKNLQKYAQERIDKKYSSGDGGWIQYRVLCKEHFDIYKNCCMLNVRSSSLSNLTV